MTDTKRWKRALESSKWALIVVVALLLFGLVGILGASGFLGETLSGASGVLIATAVIAWIGASIAGYRVYDAFGDAFGNPERDTSSNLSIAASSRRQ